MMRITGAPIAVVVVTKGGAFANCPANDKYNAKLAAVLATVS